MTPNGSDITLINSDPTWATIDASAARSNRPDFADFLRGPGKYFEGREFELSSSPEVAEKFERIAQGLASQETGKESSALDPCDKIDFEAPVGMIATIKNKAETLPTREAFFPIVTGYGTTDRAAIDAWRTFTTTFTPTSTFTGQALGRGISR